MTASIRHTSRATSLHKNIILAHLKVLALLGNTNVKKFVASRVSLQYRVSQLAGLWHFQDLAYSSASNCSPRTATDTQLQFSNIIMANAVDRVTTTIELLELIPLALQLDQILRARRIAVACKSVIDNLQ